MPVPRPFTEAAPRVAIIGGGPAGLMAAEVLSQAGVSVDVFERMPTVGRKLLMAGRGGLNITHAEPAADFLDRYSAGRDALAPLIADFGADAIRTWAAGLGIDTFVGSSGKVFPAGMKAAPLLRAWLARLRAAGVRIHPRRRWTGWHADGALAFDTPDGPLSHRADATVLALGGGSWARLGSDGRWVDALTAAGVGIAPLAPSNCGFELDWSTHFRERFAGEPLKTVTLRFTDPAGRRHERHGECLVTAAGLQGPLIYALSAPLRHALATGPADITLDLLPDRSEAQLRTALAAPRGRRSLSNHLQRSVGLKGVKAGLLREVLAAESLDDPVRVAATLKALPLQVLRPRPIDQAISTAGGVRFAGLDPALMLTGRPGVFCAGEMLDWDAPTGGYLLTACLATGRAAGAGALRWLSADSRVTNR
ncbi:TIGR03862 family flavoprotein [Denitromonas ohlonensis]|uniref:TIGR03862 family flavoprotein n=2 Tax=Denitromonas TaxID=139331 RepID=A0A557RQ86_9RHOO|nr:TIGR03862 family flavoprotein [Denitromonas ohlonensis]TVO67262.1 TIGR03862 family flavoprotein [Denitromonas ohlonensis]TVO79322.1 TIGR03862 family flavoprotein [Denitromonas ohlonensis]